MISSLSKNIIFLHGLSGSGKGELQRQLIDFHEQNGYQSVSMSAGDIVRRSLSNSQIRQVSLSGNFFDTLDPLRDGLEEISGKFAQTMVNTGGKAILIVDGVVRKSAYQRGDGSVVPSQLYQLATFMDNAFSDKTKELPELYAYA